MFNLHRKFIGDVPLVYREPATAAIVFSSILATGSSIHASSEQKKIADEAAARAENERLLAEKEAERIARETKPEELGAEGVKLGLDDGTSGSFEDFLQPKTTAKTSGLNSSGFSGLGFS